MSHLFALLCTAAMLASVFLLFLGLPGTWCIFGLALLWGTVSGAAEFTWQFFLLLFVLAGVGEAVEFLAGYYGAKRFGGSNRGSLGGMVGAIVGGIACAPLFFGFGALLGALGGAFVGCFVVEKMQGKNFEGASSAAFGTTLGRFGGFVVKLGIGMSMLWLSLPRLWASL